MISADTIGFHYGKHHRAYVDTLNRLLETDPLKGRPLVEVVKATAGDAAKAGLFNNAAQIWNHDFYWKSLKPNGGGKPTGRMAGMIDAPSATTTSSVPPWQRRPSDSSAPAGPGSASKAAN